MACASSHGSRILRRATFAISFRTWTLAVPPFRTNASARSAFRESPEIRYSNTFVSKKSPGIRLFPVEFEIGRQSPAKRPEAGQKFLAGGLAGDDEFARTGNPDFDVVPLLEIKSLDHRGGKPNSQVVSAFRFTHHPS